MPVRNIIYDALQYGKQVADIAAKHRASEGDSKGHSRGEYLSGFYKEDKFTPVITLVLHFGANEWDGPLSLHEMMLVWTACMGKNSQEGTCFRAAAWKM